MKVTLRNLLIGSAVIAAPQMASASLLVGFHSFTDDQTTEIQDYAVAGFSGTVTKLGADYTNSISRSTGGSSDGTYGNVTLVSNNPAADDGFARSVESLVWNSEDQIWDTAHSFPVFRFTQTGEGVTPLGALLFDAATNDINPSAGLVVSYLTSTSATHTYSSITLPVVPNSNLISADYGDFAFSLAGLELAQGEWIEFTFDGNPYARVDNVGLAAIPEPGSMLALGCLIGSGALLRNRRRRA